MLKELQRETAFLTRWEALIVQVWMNSLRGECGWSHHQIRAEVNRVLDYLKEKKKEMSA